MPRRNPTTREEAAAMALEAARRHQVVMRENSARGDDAIPPPEFVMGVAAYLGSLIGALVPPGATPGRFEQVRDAILEVARSQADDAHAVIAVDALLPKDRPHS